MLPLLLACGIDGSKLDSWDTARSDTGTLDTGAPDTGDTGTPDDTAPDDTADTADTGTALQACWLGPARDDSVCSPVLPFDAATFGEAYDYPPPYGGSSQYDAPARYVDLSREDPDRAVAPNFVMGEFMLPEKGRWGVLQAVLVERLQELRDRAGAPVRVTSGYRSPGWNAGVGGVEYSRHQYGDAADIDVTGMSVEQAGEACEDVGASYVGLYEDGHTHCDWRDETLDFAFYDVARRRPAAPAARVRAPRPAIRATLTREGAAWVAPATGFDEGEPLRAWEALDARGGVLLRAQGRRFLPPTGTTRIRVQVGGQLTLTHAL